MAEIRDIYTFYNQEQKIAFIDFLESKDKGLDAKSKERLCAFFNVTNKAEELLEIDLADMDTNILMRVIKTTISNQNARQIKIKINFLNKYIDWSIETGRSSLRENPIKDINFDELIDLDEVKRGYFKDPQDLMDFVSIIDNPNVSNTHLTVIVGLMMLYIGVPQNLVAHIKKDQFHWRKRTIEIRGVNLPIPDEFFPYFKRYRDLKNWVVVNCTTKYEVPVLQNYEYFLQNRPTTSKEPSILQTNKAVTVGLTRLKEKQNEITGINRDIKKVTISYSGIYYRVYQKELQGEGADDNLIKEFQLQRYLSTGKKYKVIGDMKIKFKQYEAWKQIFYDL